MKFLDLIMRRKVEAKSQSEQKNVSEQKNSSNKSTINTASKTELFFDDGDIGYC